MIKKLSVVFLLTSLLAALVLSASSEMRLDAQEPEFAKTDPRSQTLLYSRSQTQFGNEVVFDGLSVSSAASLYGSGEFFLPPYLSDNDRMGYNRTSSHDTTPLKAGWYHNWGTSDAPAHPGGVEFGHTIYFNVSDVSYCSSATQHSQISVNVSDANLISRAQANPGAMWMIGNEPDSYYNGSPIHPHLYAELYHYYYTLIKTADPAAKVAIASIVQPSPLRMEYLDKVLTHYQNTYTETLQTDLWGIHLYRLNEGPCGSWGATVPPDSSSNYGWSVNFSPSDILSLSKIEQSIRDFRQWMYDRDYGDVPLIITEYGVLPPPSYFGFSDAVAAQFLADTTNMFLTATDETTGLEADGDRLMQMWAWFSTDHNPPAGWAKYGGDLFTSGGDLTVIGQRFVNMTSAHYTPYIDLQPVPPTTTLVYSTGISITAYMQNRGNITATEARARVSLVDPDGGTVAEITLDLGQINPRYAGSAALIVHTWHLSYTEEATMTIPYTVNITVASSDDNPGNDTLSYQIRSRPLLDLALSDLELSGKSPFLVYNPVTRVATATIANVGLKATPQTSFEFRLKTPAANMISLGDPRFVPILQPGESLVFTTTASITQAGNYEVWALLPQAIGPAEITNNNQLSRSITAIDPKDLSLQKTAPFIAKSDQPITYTLTLTNSSSASLTHVVITDAIPVGATYLRGGARLGDVVSWSLASLAGNGGVAHTSFVVTATNNLVNDDYQFTADGDIHFKADEAVVTFIEEDISTFSISKIAPAITISGAPVTYTLTVVNNSPLTLTTPLITDVIPTGANYIRGGTKVGNVVSWTFAALASGGQAQATFVVTTSTAITNSDYRVSAEGGALSAVGDEAIVTVIGSETPIDPGQGGMVIITDALNAEVTQRLTIEIPSDAVSEALTLAYASVPPPDSWQASPSLGFTDLVFHLQAYGGTGSLPLPNLPLLEPMTITIHYTNTAISDESRLGLYYFDETQQKWLPAPATCSGSGSLQFPPKFETKTIQATACRLGQFALLLELYPSYLPLIFRNS